MTRLFAASMIALFAASLTPVAQAQTSDSIFTVSEKQNRTFIDVGGAAVVRDVYVGSETSSEYVLPYVSAGYQGRYFFNPALGAGAYAINNDYVRLGATGNLSLGRKGKDTPFNNDVFDVDPTLTAAGFGRIYLPIAALDGIVTVPLVGGLSGMRFDTLLSTSITPIKGFKITPGVRATYHSSGWLNTNYGITEAQAAAIDGLSPLDLDGQISTLGVHTAVYVTLANDYELIGAFNHSILQSDIRDSPLTPKNTGTTFAVALAKKF